MEIQKLIKKVKESNVWKEKDMSKFYLAHIFHSENDWQVGFYNGNHMIVFIDGEKITASEKEEVFKEPGKKVIPLEIEKVKINFKKAAEDIDKFVKNKYPQDLAMKTFTILQADKENIFYNTTILSKTFHTLNIRISAIDGKILKSDRLSLFDMGKVK